MIRFTDSRSRFHAGISQVGLNVREQPEKPHTGSSGRVGSLVGLHWLQVGERHEVDIATLHARSLTRIQLRSEYGRPSE